MLREHYFLRSAKGVRNACANSSAIINGFGSASHDARPAPDALTVALRDAGEYDRALAAFSDLAGYRDSTLQDRKSVV